MSRSKIDEAIYDQERYERLREQGVSKGRAKRVSTVPLRREKKIRESAASEPPLEEDSLVEGEMTGEPSLEGPKVSTTSPRTGI